MDKLSIEDLPIKGKKVLMRVDFNVPLNEYFKVSDPTRILVSLPSIKYVLDQGGSLILMSHMGRPKFEPISDLSLSPCAQMLSEILKKEVKMAPDCVGSKVEEMAKKLLPGEVLLLENLRFHRAELFPDEDPSFAQKLASLGELYVDDAFGTAHRRHSSICAVPQFFPGKAAAGYSMQKEIQFLGNALNNPKRPFYAIIGGAKISTKIGAVKSLLEKVDALLIGGAMAYTFIKAQGISIGDSLYKEDQIPFAKEILEESKSRGLQLILPLDFKIARECSNDTPSRFVATSEGIPQGYQGLDIGPQTIEKFCSILSNASTIIWNGPLGVYELDAFAEGTLAIAKALAASKATTIVGGGDSIAAIHKADLADRITHLSTGGGASLEFIEKGTLPGIDALSNRPLQEVCC